MIGYNYSEGSGYSQLHITGKEQTFRITYRVNFNEKTNRITSLQMFEVYCVAAEVYEMTPSYNEKGQLASYELDSNEKTYSYDALGRLTGETMETYQGVAQNKTYGYQTYTSDGVKYQTNRLTSINDTTWANIDSTSTYNTNGYVSGITYNGLTVSYEYDAVGRLTKETNNYAGVLEYVYDDKNNITSTTKNGSTTNYTYDSQGRLTSAGTDTFEYDALGNPTTYKGKAFFWTQGRKLASGTLNGNSFQYSYDGNGMRHKKVVDGATTEYYYSGAKLLAEYRKNTFELLSYFYDQSGIAGMIYKGEYYYFDKNTLGDVIAIRDEQGAVVGEYYYDAWGNIIYQSGSMASKNPFRYRGYYYDSETGFYYLQTRYYDPEIGRFINADNYELVGTLASVPGQLNMYAYCNNNPVMYTDPTGQAWWHWLVGGALIVATTVAMVATAGLVATALGVSAGVASAMTVGAGVATATAGVVNLGLQFSNGVEEFDIGSLMFDMTFSGTVSMITSGLGAALSGFSPGILQGAKLLTHKGLQAGATTLISLGAYTIQSCVKGEDINLYGLSAAAVTGFVAGTFFNLPARRAFVLALGLETIGYGDSFIKIMRNWFSGF